MKKINSIWYGSKIIGVGIVFLAVIPSILFGIENLLRRNRILMLSAKISIVLGVIILVIFSVVLIVELKQDKKLNKQYKKIRYRKIMLTNSTHECQNCGNLKIKKDDRDCNICGIKFRE